MTVRVVIADDHPVFRDGLRTLLESTGAFDVVGEAADGEEAVRLAARLQPDVVIMDLQLPVLNGIGATEAITRSSPDMAVLALTMFDDDASVYAALAAGARGYCLKGADQREIVHAISSLARGESTFSAAVADRVGRILSGRTSGPPVPFPQLTAREREVLDRVARGWTNDRIAGELFLSGKTVRNHVSNVFSKLGVAHRSEAVVLAREAGLGRERIAPDAG